MSLAYSLVNRLAVPQTDEDDKTLVIDHYTRTIIIPSGIKSLGVENDDDVLRLNFRMPRYLGTVDLYNFKIHVNYINAQGKDDIYEVTDATIVGDNITFSWQVGPTATAYIGTTSFNVEMTLTDSESVIKQRYGTAVAKLPVLQGLKCSRRVVSKYSDILAQWEARLFGFGDTEEAKLVAASETQQQNIVNKGEEVLATIPADYTSAVKMADSASRTKADAIICSAEGETITVSDSSDDYLRGLRIFGKTTQVKTTGKNLLDYAGSGLETFTNGGVTVTNNNDGSFTISGSGTLTSDIGTYHYYTHAQTVELFKAGKLYFKDEATTVPKIYIHPQLDGTKLGSLSVNGVTEFEITQDMLDNDTFRIIIGFYGVSGNTIKTGTLKPMLYQDGDGTFEKYTGGKASPSPEWPQELVSVDARDVNATVYGKNLLDDTQLVHHPEYIDTYSSALSVLDYEVRKDKTYTLSFDTENTGVLMYVNPNSGFTYAQFNMDGKRHSFTTKMTKDVTNSEYTLALVSIAMSSGVACGQISNVQIELGSEATPYEQFRTAQTLTLTERAIPGIPVTSGGNYTDANGQQWISNEIDLERGVYVQKVGRFTLTNDRTYYYNTDTPGKEFFYTANGENAKAWETRMYCSHFPIIGGSVSMESDYWMQFSGSGGIRFRHKDLTSLNALATWLVDNSVNVCYVLETPIETPLTADEIAAFKELKSNCPSTTVINDGGAGMLLRYNADTETWITNLIDEKIAAAVAKL